LIFSIVEILLLRIRMTEGGSLARPYHYMVVILSEAKNLHN